MIVLLFGCVKTAVPVPLNIKVSSNSRFCG